MKPELRRVDVAITLNPSTLKLAKAKCYKDGKSLSQKIDELLTDYILTEKTKTNAPT